MNDPRDKREDGASDHDAQTTAEKMEGGPASKAPSRIILGLVIFVLIGLMVVLKLFGVI
jgi:hypothetical protein